jgi:hypothetical protein
MKNFRFTLIPLFALFCLNATSQIFIGGSIGLSTSKSTSTDNYTQHNIRISPDIGKYVTEKFAFGVSLNANSTVYKSSGETDMVNSSAGISPFLRYHFYKSNKFSLFGQGNIGLDFIKDKPYQDADERKKIRTYISFNPGLAYDLTDRIQLQTWLNFLSFRYDYITTIDDSPKQKTSSFNFYSSLNHLLSLEYLRIGAIYKFNFRQ